MLFVENKQTNKQDFQDSKACFLDALNVPFFWGGDGGEREGCYFLMVGGPPGPVDYAFNRLLDKAPHLPTPHFWPLASVINESPKDGSLFKPRVRKDTRHSSGRKGRFEGRYSEEPSCTETIKTSQVRGWKKRE